MTEINNIPSIIISDDFKILEQCFPEETLVEQITDLENNNMTATFDLWNGSLLNHFQLYELCQNTSYSIHYNQMTFSSKSEAMSWICSYQLRRTDLSEEYRKYLVGKKFALELTIQKKNLEHSDNHPNTLLPLKASKVQVARNLENGLKLKFSTIQKYYVYSEALDHIIAINPIFAKKILNGQVRISHQSIVKISEQSEEVIQNIMKYIEDNNIEHLGYSELTENFQFKNVQPVQPSKPCDDEPKIRQMPAYDPDAEISSIALTIPSWVSSMERAHKRTNFTKTTPPARINLIKQLAILERTIYIIQKEIEEVM